MAEGQENPSALKLSQQAAAKRPMRLQERGDGGLPAYFQDLNPAQREAAEALKGPVLMLAGAGTGKTKTLMARLTHLVKLGYAREDQILAVTFTNKAAKEMALRLVELPYGLKDEPLRWMGTFHALSVKILRRHAELVGLKSNFTILDTDDQIRLLKQVLQAANIDEKRWPARALAALIDRWKNRAWRPEAVPSTEAIAFDHKGSELYAAYQARLLVLNACDFGDLLLHCVTLFQSHPDILAQYQQRFRYILVDEYQDTNVAQYLWLRLLAQSHHNICCVGDDDQSIYGWRGAEVGNILRFEKDFPGAHVIRLEQNYRSTPHILAAASGVIAANEGRLGKTLWTAQEGGEKLRLIGHWDGEEEARWIGEEIEALQRGTRGGAPVSLDDQAILVRASHQMRAFEDRFLTIGLPYRVVGGPRFYERLEIRDAMAYFRLAVSPDDDLAFERVVNTPKRGFGEKALADLQRWAREREVSLFEAAGQMLAAGAYTARVAGPLRVFHEAVRRWHESAAAVGYDHIRLAEDILEEAGYSEMWLADKTPEAPGRLENLKELIKALESFENLQGFLEHVALIMDNDTEAAEEKVTIMTLHGAKGLEFPVVFLPGWEDGLFPSQRSMDESGQKGLEEERRLAYVGITRAEELCTISFAANRRVHGRWQSALPSRFIDELPPEHVEVLTPPGLYGGGYGAAAPSFGGESALQARAAEADAYASPGWRRMAENRARPGLRLPQEARGLTLSLDATPLFQEGDRVFHDKFGYGLVIGVEGDKIEVDFSKAGVKRVLARFLQDGHAVPF